MIRAYEDWKAGNNKQSNVIFVSFHVCVCVCIYSISICTVIHTK